MVGEGAAALRYFLFSFSGVAWLWPCPHCPHTSSTPRNYRIHPQAYSAAQSAGEESRRAIEAVTALIQVGGVVIIQSLGTGG